MISMTGICTFRLFYLCIGTLHILLLAFAIPINLWMNICGPLEGVRDNCIDGDMFNGTLLEWDDQLKLNQLDFSVLADVEPSVK